MIFRPELARLIVRGKKTQTRRPLRRPPMSEWKVSRKTGRRRRRAPWREVTIDGQAFVACRYEAGRSYAVQPGRTKAADARIVVTSVECQRVGAITFDAARAEGFRTTSEFKAYWTRLYEPELLAGADQRVDGIHCVPLEEEMLVECFEARHADTLAWAITFELDTSHHPLLLAPAAHQERDADERGYTHDPQHALSGSADAGEAIDPTLLDYYTADAHDRHSGRPGRREEQLRRRANSLAASLRAFADGRDGIDTTTVLAQLEQVQQHLRVLHDTRKRAA